MIVMGVSAQAIEYTPLTESEVGVAAVRLYEAAQAVWAKAEADLNPLGDGRKLSELNVGSDVNLLIKKYAAPHYANEPTVVDSATFEKLTEPRWYRGVRPNSDEVSSSTSVSTYFENLKCGDFYTGMAGNGIYAGDDVSIAKPYAGDSGLVCMFVYNNAARVISARDTERILEKYFADHPEYKDNTSDAKHKFFNAQESALGTAGFVGRLLGYDVIFGANTEIGGVHVCSVLNRGILTIDENPC
ncbi:hypothetical protein FACS1894198_6050 [Clostridia bacterium]|nr:hypothetical protein FACS1894198_6050 [Clostridia bacterium]